MTDALVLDNTARSAHEGCPRMYEYRILTGWVRRDSLGGALLAGAALHLGLAEWYRSHSLSAAQEAIRQGWEAEGSPDSSDWRTLEKVLTTMRQYTQAYPTENFKIVGAPELPFIEQRVTIDTGLSCFDGTPIHYGGLIDTVVEDSVGYAIMDHKTCSVFGEDGSPARYNFWASFKPDSQMTGYVWLAQQITDKPIRGVIINGIGWNRVAATRFDRYIVNYSAEDIEEWKRSLICEANQIRRNQLAGFYPMKTHSCITKYGRCAYHGICSLEPTIRNAALDQDYIKRPWSHEETER